MKPYGTRVAEQEQNESFNRSHDFRTIPANKNFPHKREIKLGFKVFVIDLSFPAYARDKTITTS